MNSPSDKDPTIGPFKPTLILHGGAGSITRHNLPPDLYKQYRSSLLMYLKSTHSKLQAGSTALDAACHAVSMMEDDPLFNCARGSVFTEAGTIEMEASVMVCSIHSVTPPQGGVKRAAAVSLVRNTRHPILLARELLLDGGDGMGGIASMHCHLSGKEAEEWGWSERRLERKEDGWFWTKKRWDEHQRGLHGELLGNDRDGMELPSQGTVGAVCMDSWGNLAVATSTGGLTNKKVGRIGDTPTIGAGFWAESWDEPSNDRVKVIGSTRTSWSKRVSSVLQAGFGDILQDCLPQQLPFAYESLRNDIDLAASTQIIDEKTQYSWNFQGMTSKPPDQILPINRHRRHAVAMSGTGNGDSFLRTNAVRTAAAITKFCNDNSLISAVSAVSGPGGELQRSAGDRWKKTGEGQGGIIGIELCSDSNEGKVVFDFNCGGLWRAWVDSGTGIPQVMVFREDFET